MTNKTFIVFLFSAVAVFAQSADSYEPNNDFSTAYPIAIGDTVINYAEVIGVDSLVNPFDVDYYKVTLDSGKVLIN